MATISWILFAIICAREALAQNQLEPEYLKHTFFGSQRSIPVPEIPASISDPALASPKPPAPPPGLTVFARPQGEANLINTGGQGGPREGKSAQDQPVGVALGQPDVQGPGFVPQPLLDTQPLLPTPPPSQKQFAFQPQVPGAEDVRFLEPATKPQPRDRPPQFFRPRPNGPPSIGAEEVNFLDPIPPQQPQVSELKDQPPKFLTPRPNGPPPSSFDAEEVSFLNPTQSLQPQDSGPKD